jgi:hypothetical protein
MGNRPVAFCGGNRTLEGSAREKGGGNETDELNGLDVDGLQVTNAGQWRGQWNGVWYLGH